MPTSARIAIAALALFIAVAAAFSQDTRGTGSFDINKVRELSAGSSGTDSAAAATASRKESANGVFIIFRIILTLAFVIALILGGTWLMKRYGLGRGSGVGGRGAMEIVEVLPLGQNRNMVLFRVQERVYLCGQTPSSLSLIDTIDGPEAASILSTVKARPVTGQFKDAFNQFITKMKKSA
jgi:flagellar biosynthetic protein FliO